MGRDKAVRVSRVGEPEPWFGGLVGHVDAAERSMPCGGCSADIPTYHLQDHHQEQYGDGAHISWDLFKWELY